MKTLYMLFSAFLLALTAQAQTKVYINAGHGSWGPDDRPLPTIPYPMLSETGRPDTCGFYESNTNLWKCLELGRRLRAAGYRVRQSRVKNGPYPYVAGAGNAEQYNRPLSEIAAEAEAWGADMFLSVHSNAAADGALANYPLFLYRGTDAEDACPGSKDMCRTLWPYLTESMHATVTLDHFEFMSHYKNATNIRGDRDFYNYTWTNYKGYQGYLGVLMQSVPGFLSEGYFHTYQPARHRALNEDWCRQEGIRYFRGICAYFDTPADTRGCIMGMVKTRMQKMKGYDHFNYQPDTHDQYLPLNGTEVRLRNAAGEEVARYLVDNNYNGIFVFTDLEPGTYYIDTKLDGYTTHTKTNVKVTANKTTYQLIYKYPGESTDFEPATGIADLQGTAGIAPDDTYEVYDLMGRLIQQGLYVSFNPSALPSGTYVLKSGQLSRKFTK